MIAARIEAVVARLRVLPGPAERLAALVDRAKRVPPPRDGERNETNLVPGCVSRVWLVGAGDAGIMRFRADADSAMVKGLVALAWEIADGQTIADLSAAPDEPGFLAALGLETQLSPTRLNGAGQVWRRMRQIARDPRWRGNCILEPQMPATSQIGAGKRCPP